MTVADLLDIARIHGLHLSVTKTGDLIDASGLVVLDRTDNSGTVAYREDIKPSSRQIVTVEDTDSVVQSGIRIVILHVDAGTFIGGNHAFEGDLDSVVLLYVAPELLDCELYCVSVVEVGILLPGVDVKLLLLGVVQRSHCDVAVAVVCRG